MRSGRRLERDMGVSELPLGADLAKDERRPLELPRFEGGFHGGRRRGSVLDQVEGGIRQVAARKGGEIGSALSVGVALSAIGQILLLLRQLEAGDQIEVLLVGLP